jgi:hypothetical protein
VVPAPDDDEMAFGDTSVDVAWYEDRVKVTFKKANPAAITQAYLSGAGRDATIESRQLVDADEYGDGLPSIDEIDLLTLDEIDLHEIEEEFKELDAD